MENLAKLLFMLLDIIDALFFIALKIVLSLLIIEIVRLKISSESGPNGTTQT